MKRLMNNTYLQKAIEIALFAHQGQERRDGDIYFNHVSRVANNKMFINDNVTKAAAYLHDTVEDTHITLEDLARMNLPEEVIEIVNRLTKPSHVSYEQYIDRICESLPAMLVKLSDLHDNSDTETLDTITSNDIKRFVKYERAKAKIWSKILSDYPDTFKQLKKNKE